MSVIWYPHYPGDYIRDTLHLSLEEDGAYRRLIDHYYSSGQPLPSDNSKLSRILRVSTRKTRSLMSELKSFFDEKDGYFYHKKVEFELDKLLKKREKAQANGKAGGKASAIAKAKAKGVPTTTTTISLVENTKDKAAKKPDKYQIFNEQLKPLYPKREGSNPWRAAAESMNARLKDGFTMEALIAGTKRYAAFCEAKQFTNTERVMQAKRFYGRDCEFANDWKISRQAP